MRAAVGRGIVQCVHAYHTLQNGTNVWILRLIVRVRVHALWELFLSLVLQQAGCGPVARFFIGWIPFGCEHDVSGSISWWWQRFDETCG
jgi:hypothetical protein